MDVSFILSDDELYTLLYLAPEKTEAGQRFIDEALSGAEICDLTGLTEKNLARIIEDEIELESVLRLVTGAISKATEVKKQGEAWFIGSPWVNLLCEDYRYNDKHRKITPVKNKEAEEK